jgi:4-hydroxybenzoate polyprenyltransferase
MTTAVLSPPHPVNATALPLCVDLDGTLVRSDTLVEGFCALATDPRVVTALLSLANGRAAFKQSVAAGARLDPALLPYNDTLLTYLRAQKAAGRDLVLATAADRRIAHAIATHLGIFDEVIASDGTTNLKGAAKAQALTDRFGVKGFVYAGNATSDLPIWRQAAAVILVNAPASAVGELRGTVPIELSIADQPPVLPELLKAMRPHQWVKNALVFVPILTAHALTETAAWVGGVLMFLAFCFTASAIYLVNDLLDIAADRAHPRKRLRPFARGAVPLPVGVAAAGVLLVAGLALALIGHVAWVVALYALMSISYSFGLKQLPLVDVFMLGGLYTIRLFGGGEATGHRLSLWLLGFSSFLFLSLALLKRVEEMMSLSSVGGSKAARRGYSATDTPILQLFGVASAFASSIVLALFVQSEATAQNYASPSLLWFVVPLLLFWQCRMWLSGARGYMHHDPIVYAGRDRISWAIGATTAAVLIAAKSIPLFAG